MPGILKEKRMEERLRRHIELMRRHPGISSRELLEKAEGVESLRTIQNDLRYLMEEWDGGRVVRVGRGYRVELHRPVEEAFEERERKIYIKLALEQAEKMSDFSEHHEAIVRDLGLDRLEIPYYVKAESYEELDSDEEEVSLLAEAIGRDHPVIFRYREKDFHVAPVRLVNFDGIWYLYGKDLEEDEERENPWKTWLLSEIEKVEVEYAEKHSIDDEEVEEDLEEAPSPHFVPDRKVRVLLRVDAEAAELFELKEHFPDQKILSREEDGSLRVEAEVSVYEDLERELKSWLPHLEILEPEEYRKRLLEELEAYLERVRG
jgi:predicted DNA-binding transcriptional regulator YafY